jgi:hypothetical protein
MRLRICATLHLHDMVLNIKHKNNFLKPIQTLRSNNISALTCICPITAKIKPSHNKSWCLRQGKECWTSILTLTFSTIRWAQISALHTSCTLPPRKLLHTRFCYRLMDPQTNECRQTKLDNLKISKYPTGIEPGTSHLVVPPLIPLCGTKNSINLNTEHWKTIWDWNEEQNSENTLHKTYENTSMSIIKHLIVHTW